MSPLDELCQVLGYHATSNLVAFFGDSWLNVPLRTDSEHVLNYVIGARGFKALVDEWGGTQVWISDPTVSHARMRRDRHIWDGIDAGKTPAEIAGEIGLTERRVQQVAAKLPGKKPRQKAGRKSRCKNPVAQLDLFPADPGQEAVTKLADWAATNVPDASVTPAEKAQAFEDTWVIMSNLSRGEGRVTKATGVVTLTNLETGESFDVSTPPAQDTCGALRGSHAAGGQETAGEQLELFPEARFSTGI